MPNNSANSRRRDIIMQTAQPRSQIEPLDAKVAKDERDTLGYDLYNQVLQGLSDRNAFNVNLTYYEDLYEMHIEAGASDTPWPDASAVFVPIVPTVLDKVASNLAKIVFQPRFFLINGNTPEAAGKQAEVERFYNSESARYNWTDRFFQQMHLGLRDGVGVMEILWKRKVSMRKRLVYKPVQSDEGLPQVGEDQEQTYQKVIENHMDIDFDGVELTPIPLRNFAIFPIWSPGVQDALMVARRVYISEEDLWAMQKAGTLWKDKLEEILRYEQEGNDERNVTGEELQTITADDQINISQGMINQSNYPRQRGPFGFWVIYSKQYDLDQDGICENNVFWVHELSQRLVGKEVYKYWHGEWPFVGFIPMPRHDIWYGYSIPERLRTLQEEINTKHNQRNNAADRALEAPVVVKEGSRFLAASAGGAKLGPGTIWEVSNPQTDVNVIQLPDVPLSTWQEEQYLTSLAEEILGVAPPMASGRPSAAEMQMLSQAAQVRLDLIANRCRDALKAAFRQIHQLYIQYAPDNMTVNANTGGLPQRLTIDKQTLAMDFDLDIVGSGGPLDKAQRAQDMMMVYTLLMKNPLVAGNLERTWMITQMLLEAFDRPDIQALIGTREDALQQQQVQQQQQALQGMMGAQQEQAQQSQQGQNGAGPQGGPGGI